MPSSTASRAFLMLFAQTTTLSFRWALDGVVSKPGRPSTFIG